MEEIYGIQLMPMIKTVYVKFVNSEVYERFVEQYCGEMKFMDENGENGYVSIEPATGKRVAVKVLHVPFEMNMEMVVNEFKKCGKIIRYDANAWGWDELHAVRTGTRSIKMDIKTSIPSYIYVAGMSHYTVSGSNIDLFNLRKCGASEEGLPAGGRSYFTMKVRRYLGRFE